MGFESKDEGKEKGLGGGFGGLGGLGGSSSSNINRTILVKAHLWPSKNISS